MKFICSVDFTGCTGIVHELGVRGLAVLLCGGIPADSTCIERKVVGGGGGGRGGLVPVCGAC